MGRLLCMDVLGDVQRRGCLNNARGRNRLTERERKWLNQRDRNLFSFGLYLAFTPGMSPALIDYRDAAEFEARVAARLAGAWAIGEDMCFNNHCQLFDKDRCTACYLKNARIAVEQEMEL